MLPVAGGFYNYAVFLDQSLYGLVYIAALMFWKTLLQIVHEVCLLPIAMKIHLSQYGDFNIAAFHVLNSGRYDIIIW